MVPTNYPQAMAIVPITFVRFPCGTCAERSGSVQVTNSSGGIPASEQLSYSPSRLPPSVFLAEKESTGIGSCIPLFRAVKKLAQYSTRKWPRSTTCTFFWPLPSTLRGHDNCLRKWPKPWYDDSCRRRWAVDIFGQLARITCDENIQPIGGRQRASHGYKEMGGHVSPVMCRFCCLR